MYEFIVPMKHAGEDGIYVCAGIAGLTEDAYSAIELSIDGSEFFPLERDADFTFQSKPYSFPVSQDGIVYKVTGRVICGGQTSYFSSNIVSQNYSSDESNDEDTVFTGFSGGVLPPLPASPISLE